MRIFLSAGEASGDLLGGNLMRELNRLRPGIEYSGLGGPTMEAAGLRNHRDLTQEGIMGILPVIKAAPDLIRLIREVGRLFDEIRPDAFVPIDYPGLNFVLSKMARRRGIPVIFYVSPQLWAWGQWRARKVRRRVDRMLVILPFEEEFFAARGVTTRYVGHPLVDRLTGVTDPDDVIAEIRAGSDRVLGLLPGSRLQEVRHLLPIMLRTARTLVDRHPDLRVVLPAPPAGKERGALIRELLASDPQSPAELISDVPHGVMRHADSCLVASGTATAELAFLGTPMSILYQVSPTARFFARYLLRVPRIGMANILAGREAVPEFFFAEPPYEEIARATEGHLFDGPTRERTLAELARVKEILGPPGASERAAREVLDHLGESVATAE